MNFTSSIRDKIRIDTVTYNQSQYYGLIVCSTNNIGDDIQSLAALQFLPQVNYLINRDYISKYAPPQKTKVIINGWYTLEPWSWLPRKNLVPLFISFHLSPKLSKFFLDSNRISYLKAHSPIGCRDTYTQSILESYGIETYFSGCLTLTLSYKYDNLKSEGNYCLISDVHPEVLKVIPDEIKQRCLNLSQINSNYTPKRYTIIDSIIRKTPKYLKKLVPDDLKMKIGTYIESHPFIKNSEWYLNKLEVAYERLREIASATFVITSRLHVALPALSFGKPVIFVHENLNDPRFSGLIDFWNAYSISDFTRVAGEIDWNNLKIPNLERLNTLKKQLVERCEQFVRG